MRHRIGGLENVYMGLGADNIPCELDNTYSQNEQLNDVVKAMFEEALDLLFSDIGGFDFKVVSSEKGFKVMFGFDPAYMHDPYKMCVITSEYKNCKIEKGVATGYYGKDIEINYSKSVVDEDCDKGFMKLVDEYYPKMIKASLKEDTQNANPAN